MDIKISFGYNGETFDGNLDVIEKRVSRGEGTEVTTYVCVHGCSGARFTVERTRYKDFGAEYLSAEIYAERDTGIFDCPAWRVTFGGGNAKLIGNYGDLVNEYAEYEKDITAEPVVHRATDGRPTHVYFPYYRVETDMGKTFVALGAMGTWQAEFAAFAGGAQMRAGQYGVHTRLNAGECFRMPTLLLLPYAEDPVNTWRHFYFRHIMPKVKGGAPKPMLGIFNGACEGLDEKGVNKVRSAYENGGIDYDFWWFDAGWGTDGTGPHNALDQWFHGVNFDMNYEKFPDGLHAFGKSLKEKGKDFMLWFEPELVRTPVGNLEEFYAAHPDFDRKWILGGYSYDWSDMTLTAQMLDLGCDDCRNWLLKRVLGVMDEAGVNIYRQDMNIPPYEVWKKADAPDRAGYAENRYLAGLKKFYEGIREHCGDIFMDTCASGGGRCDLETLRFMIPLHHTDRQDMYPGDFNRHIASQQIVWRWFPYTKNNLSPSALQSDYGARSVMNSCYVPGVANPQSPDADFASVRRYTDEWREIADLFLADYYELERPTRDNEHVKAFEYFSPERGRGFAMVFAPEKCEKESYRVLLRGLRADKTYTVTDKDSGRTWEEKGGKFALDGITLAIGANRSYLLKVRERS